MKREKTDSEKAHIRQDRRRILLPYILFMLFEVVGIIAVVAVSYVTFYKNSEQDMQERGKSTLLAESQQLTGYLEKVVTSLKIVAVSVQESMQRGDERDKIQGLLVSETNSICANIDENFTGVYGLFDGVYLDGLNWVPPEDYDPRSRDWYRYAVQAGGETVIIPPYVDAQTGSIIVTVCRLLDDGKSVICMDVFLNRIQEMTENIKLSGKGYSFVINRNSMIIAHTIKKWVGGKLDGDELAFLSYAEGKIESEKEYALNGRLRTVFSRMLDRDWYVFMVVDNEDLYARSKSVLERNIMIAVSAIIILLGFSILEMGRTLKRSQMEERIVREKEVANRANKMKSEFLANMSHEIRTPINAILGMNTMIQRETKETFTRQYASDQRRSAQILLGIVNDILDFSKVESGKLEIAEEKYQMVELLRDTVSMIRPRMEEKGLEFIVEVAPKLPAVLHGDEERLRQIFINILTNAAKYTKEGRVSFTVYPEVREDGLCVCASIADTGIGIKPENLGKIFDSFQRVDEKRNRAIEGTGLGLAITKRLITLMGGEITVESVYGEGSTFLVRIPQETEGTETVGQIDFTGAALSDGTPAVYKRKKFRGTILAVDDVEMNLKVVRMYLKDSGLTVDTAMSGKECLECVARKKYDIIFLDHMMPELDGIETLKLLKESEHSNKETPVVMLTANAIRGAMEEYLAIGFDAYLSKPLEADKLEEMIERYLVPIEEEVIVQGGVASGEQEETAGRGGKTAEAVMETDVQGGVTSEEQEETAAPDADIRKQGRIDQRTGLSYCMEDKAFYCEMLSTYIKESTEKKKTLAAALENGDIKTCTVTVHAIKSTSKTIGAIGLSEMAFALELAGKEGRLSDIKAGHDALVKEYDAVIDEAGKLMETMK